MNRESTYLRKYIILKKDYLNIPGINPKGHVKIETRGNKGNISIVIENCQRDKDYQVIFLKDEEGHVKKHSIGQIITDHKGKGRINISVNLRDLELQGFSIDEISAILIRKDEDILLGSHIDKDVGTIERFLQEEMRKPNLTKEAEIELEAGLQKDPIMKIGLDTELESELGTELEEESTMEIETETEFNTNTLEKPTEIEEPIEIPKVEEKILEEEILFTKEEENPVEDIINTVEVIDNYQSIEETRKLNHRNQMTNYILNILRFFPQIQPFKLDLHGYSWWQIEDDGTDAHKGFLPYFNYLMSADYKYPFINNSITCFDQIKRYGHYLFGMYKEKGETLYYIYAIPGRFAVEEHPFRGVTGFNTWYEAIEGMGYWLLYIDPMTGEIIHPLNPMMPSF